MTQCTGSLLNHTGQPLEDDREFSEAPPIAIGAVKSAFSTLRPGEMHPFLRKSVQRALLYCLPLLVGGIVLACCTLFLERYVAELWGFLILIGGASALFGLLNLRLHECSYVGARGLARFPFPGPQLQRFNTKNSGVFVFDSAQVRLCCITG